MIKIFHYNLHLMNYYGLIINIIKINQIYKNQLEKHNTLLITNIYLLNHKIQIKISLQ